MVIETNNKEMWFEVTKEEETSFVDLFGNECHNDSYYKLYLCGNNVENVYVCNINEKELNLIKEVWA